MSQVLDSDSNYLQNKLRFEINDENREFTDQFSELMKSAIEKDAINAKVVKVHPKPGTCIKLHSTDGKKYFLNLCYSDDIPQMVYKSDDELLNILTSNPSSVKIPLSISDLKEFNVKEEMKSVIDVGLHTDFYFQIMSNDLLLHYIIWIIMTAVENKRDLKFINEDYTVLRNRKVMGSLSTHYIERTVLEDFKKRSLITEVHSEVFHEPQYRLLKLPETDSCHFYMVEIYLKGVKTVNELQMDVSCESVRLTGNGESKYRIEICLPEVVDPDSCYATFVGDKEMLSVLLPIIKM